MYISEVKWRRVKEKIRMRRKDRVRESVAECV